MGSFLVLRFAVPVFYGGNRSIENTGQKAGLFPPGWAASLDTELSSSPPIAVWHLCRLHFLGAARSLGRGVANKPPGTPVLVFWPVARPLGAAL